MYALHNESATSSSIKEIILLRYFGTVFPLKSSKHVIILPDLNYLFFLVFFLPSLDSFTSSQSSTASFSSAMMFSIVLVAKGFLVYFQCFVIYCYPFSYSTHRAEYVIFSIDPASQCYQQKPAQREWLIKRHLCLTWLIIHSWLVCEASSYAVSPWVSWKMVTNSRPSQNH